MPRKLKDEVLEQSHTAVTAEHFGVAKTLQLVRQGFYWTCHTAIFVPGVDPAAPAVQGELLLRKTSGCFETIPGCRANGAHGHGCPWSFSREQSRK